MENRNRVYIATSIDGFISDRKGGLEWLDSTPIPEDTDMGYNDFMKDTDAIIMGRKTFDTVLSFGVEWPYDVPVFVLSHSMTKIPEILKDRAFLLAGNLTEVLNIIHKKGFHTLYIDGGNVIQQFLKEDLIDEMIITMIPFLLGGGSPLFSELPAEKEFQCIKSKYFLNNIVQNHFVRKR